MFLLLWKSRRFVVMVLLLAREIKPCGNSQYLYAQLSMCRQDASSRNIGCVIILFITLKHTQPVMEQEGVGRTSRYPPLFPQPPQPSQQRSPRSAGPREAPERAAGSTLSCPHLSMPGRMERAAAGDLTPLRFPSSKRHLQLTGERGTGGRRARGSCSPSTGLHVLRAGWGCPSTPWRPPAVGRRATWQDRSA